MQEDLEYVNTMGFLPLRQERLTKLKKAIDEDDTLQHLKSVIMNGWPDEKQDLPAELIIYYNFCDKMPAGRTDFQGTAGHNTIFLVS